MKCKFDNISIRSIATCLPEQVLELSTLTDRFDAKAVADTIRGSGIERLHVARPHETTSDLALQAARLIMDSEGLDPQTIGGIVFVSLTCDYSSPATSCVLQGALGAPLDCVCFDIPYGCSGYIYGLFQAALLISSGACERVMVMGGDTYSKTVDPMERASAMVFGDGAFATLVERGTGSLAFHICSDGYNYQTVLNDRTGYRKWPENRFADYVPDRPEMEGEAVFGFIITVGPKTIRTVLEYVGWDKDEVDFYGVHQATKVTVDFMRKKLKLAHPERAPFDIANYGNTGPCTVPLLLSDWPYRAEGIDTSTWHKVVLSGYGVGLSWGSVACDLSQTKIYRPINQ